MRSNGNLHSADENIKCVHNYLEKQFCIILKAEYAHTLRTSHFGPRGTHVPWRDTGLEETRRQAFKAALYIIVVDEMQSSVQQ